MRKSSDISVIWTLCVTSAPHLSSDLHNLSVTRIPEAVHTPGTCTPSQFYMLATPLSSIDRNFANSRAFDINQVIGFVYKY